MRRLLRVRRRGRDVRGSRRVPLARPAGPASVDRGGSRVAFDGPNATSDRVRWSMVFFGRGVPIGPNPLIPKAKKNRGQSRLRRSLRARALSASIAPGSGPTRSDRASPSSRLGARRARYGPPSMRLRISCISRAHVCVRGIETRPGASKPRDHTRSLPRAHDAWVIYTRMCARGLKATGGAAIFYR